MPRYRIVIGGRELEIKGPSLADAQETALRAYPGEEIQSSSFLGDDEPEAATEPEGGSEDGN